MRAVVQRVTSAHVEVGSETVGTIGPGLLVYLGAERGDSDSDVAYLSAKIAGLRIFAGDDGRMSRSVLEVGGEVLVVSQFTLFGDVRRGRRPSFELAEEPGRAEILYEASLERLRALGCRIASGRFRADMQVHGVVDGPVTLLLDSRKHT